MENILLSAVCHKLHFYTITIITSRELKQLRSTSGISHHSLGDFVEYLNFGL